MGGQALRPICFMVMPFGIKPVDTPAGTGITEIDFNSLWEKAFKPALAALGYEPVRADKDLGTLIIKDMIERLALVDLIVADLTLPNPNVYYEVGLRHGAREEGCILISADWSTQNFDVAQMRQIRYPLPEGHLTDAQARIIAEVLTTEIKRHAKIKSPLLELGYPNRIMENAASFHDFVRELSAFQGRVTAARMSHGPQKADTIRQLVQDYGHRPVMSASVAVELLHLIRDHLSFEDVLDFVDHLPAAVSDLPVVQEQVALARSKTGNHFDAIAALEALIRLAGESSERHGLIGGRYKRLYRDTSLSDRDRQRYLDKAIEHYERGMVLDLNDFFPASNLAALLLARGQPGDAERARATNALTQIACEAAVARNTANEWVKPTLLVATFNNGDASAAEALYPQIVRQGVDDWKLDTTLQDLDGIAQRAGEDDTGLRLKALVEKLKDLLPTT